MNINLDRKLSAGLCTVVIGAIAFGSAAYAETYRFSTYMEPTNLITVYGHQEWVENVKAASNGALDFELFVGEALLPSRATMQGVADGVAHAGMYSASFAPTELPLTNALLELSFIADDSLAAAFAYTEYTFKNQGLSDEWLKNGVVFGGGLATPQYILMCRDNPSAPEDFAGKSIRTSGGMWDAFAQKLGAASVSLPSTEMYMAMDRGTIDCTMSDASYVHTGPTMHEVIDSITLLNTGSYFTAATWMYDTAFWQSLTDADRRLLLDQAAHSMVRLQLAYEKSYTDAIEFMNKAGKAVLEPEQSLIDVKNQIASDLTNARTNAKNKLGVEDPDALFNGFLEMLDVWKDRLSKVDRESEEELVKLAIEHVYGPVNESTFGM